MADLRIDRVSKKSDDSTHEGITHFSGPGYGNRWVMPMDEVIERINEGNDTYFTMVHGRRGDIRVIPGPDGSYLQTFTNGRATDVLLGLKDCLVPVAT